MTEVELLQSILDKLDQIQALNLESYTEFLRYLTFSFYVVLPFALIFGFGYWFFKQFYSRW